MTLYFIIPLSVVLLAAYIFKNSSDEMAYLAASVAGVALLVALIVAPWQLKLLLLSIAALTSTKFWFPGRQLKVGTISNILAENAKLENSITKVETPADSLGNNFFPPLVKGIYRGVNYEHSLLGVKLSEVKLNGKYRGLAWKASQDEIPRPVQPKFEIRYRGATINPQKSDRIEVE